LSRLRLPLSIQSKVRGSVGVTLKKALGSSNTVFFTNILSVASEGLKGFCNFDGDLPLIRAKENDDFDGLAIQYWKAFRLNVFVVD
jgi:hypothetical protein